MDTINEMNYEDWLVRYAEGELQPAEREAVEAWLREHPEAREELSLFLAAPKPEPLEADYEGKEELKRSVVVPMMPWKQWLTYAACAALLVGIGWQLWPALTTDHSPLTTPPEEVLIAEARPEPMPAPAKMTRAAKTPKPFETFETLETIENFENFENLENFEAPAPEPDPLPLVPQVDESTLPPLVRQVDRATFNALLAESFPTPDDPLSTDPAPLTTDSDTLIILSPRQEPSLLAARSEELVDGYRFWTSILDQSRAAFRDAAQSLAMR